MKLNKRLQFAIIFIVSAFAYEAAASHNDQSFGNHPCIKNTDQFHNNLSKMRTYLDNSGQYRRVHIAPGDRRLGQRYNMEEFGNTSRARIVNYVICEGDYYEDLERVLRYRYDCCNRLTPGDDGQPLEPMAPSGPIQQPYGQQAAGPNIDIMGMLGLGIQAFGMLRGGDSGERSCGFHDYVQQQPQPINITITIPNTNTNINTNTIVNTPPVIIPFPIVSNTPHPGPTIGPAASCPPGFNPPAVDPHNIAHHGEDVNQFPTGVSYTPPPDHNDPNQQVYHEFNPPPPNGANGGSGTGMIVDMSGYRATVPGTTSSSTASSAPVTNPIVQNPGRPSAPATTTMSPLTVSPTGPAVQTKQPDPVRVASNQPTVQTKGAQPASVVPTTPVTQPTRTWADALAQAKGVRTPTVAAVPDKGVQVAMNNRVPTKQLPAPGVNTEFPTAVKTAPNPVAVTKVPSANQVAPTQQIQKPTNWDFSSNQPLNNPKQFGNNRTMPLASTQKFTPSVGNSPQAPAPALKPVVNNPLPVRAQQQPQRQPQPKAWTSNPAPARYVPPAAPKYVPPVRVAPPAPQRFIPRAPAPMQQRSFVPRAAGFNGKKG